MFKIFRAIFSIVTKNNWANAVVSTTSYFRDVILFLDNVKIANEMLHCVMDDLIHDWNQERVSNHHMYKGIDLSTVFSTF